MAGPDMKDLEKRMNGALDALRNEFGGLRTGRHQNVILGLGF